MTTRPDKQTFQNEDLVLRVSENISPTVWDDTRYDAFIDELCGFRDYQKTAIRTTLRYLLGAKYANLRELANENFNTNDQLQQRYGSWASLERQLQIPDKLSCSIDLATGTGKSFVLYGLAAILLAEGKVDRVLVLCPSNTIEAGLLEKFRLLAGSADLRDLLPPDSRVRTPHIINASETIVDGSICVENYHAVLEHVKSSIQDSLTGKGERVAVFCDEAHHVANETGQEAKKWKQFLLSPDYGFNYLVGVSGTCYVGDDYFADVIYRFSLRQAMEQRWIKVVEYLKEISVSPTGPDEKWQLIYKKHQDWKKKLKNRGIRPLTIVITKNISDCDRVTEELQSFLQDWENITPDQAQEKVLAVSSGKNHQPNLSKLSTVDSSASKVEWIVSVSMLSEGWDVKNVFQIVPHEERAFNSKLLIAQVLGRGLRKPNGWTGEEPVVTVFNHDAWFNRIQHLVNEVLEIERRLASRVVEQSPYHFDLHNLDYARHPDTTESTKAGEYNLLEDGYVALPTQVETQEVSMEFVRGVSGDLVKIQTSIAYKTETIEEVATEMYRRLQTIDEESQDADDPCDRTNYTKKFPLQRLEEIVRESLKQANVKTARITKENRQKFLAALGTLRRKAAKRVVYKLNPKTLQTVNTKTRQSDSCSSLELRKGDNTVFYPPEVESNLPDEQLEFFSEVVDPDGDYLQGREPITNSCDFKTPLNLAIADGKPERRFIRELCTRNNAQALDAWLKNTNQKFYWIEYSWKKGKKGDHARRGEFSPDFFIKKGDMIFVVEVKDDPEINDPPIETIKKWEFARQHFQRLNEWLETVTLLTRYQLNFISPHDFGKFFQQLRNNDLVGFTSELDIAIQQTLRQNDSAT